jgi:hypothetical protein
VHVANQLRKDESERTTLEIRERLELPHTAHPRRHRTQKEALYFSHSHESLAISVGVVLASRAA